MKRIKVILLVFLLNTSAFAASLKPQTPGNNDLYSEYINQGVYYFEQNQLNKAKYLFIKALKVNPKGIDAYINLATVSMKRNNFTNAIKILEKPKAFPEKLKQDIVYYNLGLCLQSLGKADEAIKCYGKAIDINPLLKEALLGRGILYLNKKNLNMALIDIVKARTLFRDTGQETLSHKCDAILAGLIKSLANNKTLASELLDEGSKSFESKRNEEAIALFKISALIYPQDKETYYRLAIVYTNSGNLKEAINCFNKTIEIDNSAIKAYINLGAIYGKLKDYNAALSILNKAMKLQKNNPKVYYNIAIVYDAEGKNKKALQYLKKAKTIAVKKEDKELLQRIDEVYKSF